MCTNIKIEDAKLRIIYYVIENEKSMPIVQSDNLFHFIANRFSKYRVIQNGNNTYEIVDFFTNKPLLSSKFKKQDDAYEELFNIQHNFIKGKATNITRFYTYYSTYYDNYENAEYAAIDIYMNKHDLLNIENAKNEYERKILENILENNINTWEIIETLNNAKKTKNLTYIKYFDEFSKIEKTKKVCIVDINTEKNILKFKDKKNNESEIIEIALTDIADVR